MLGTQDLESLAVGTLLCAVEVTEHGVTFDTCLVVRAERRLTLKLQPAEYQNAHLYNEVSTTHGNPRNLLKFKGRTDFTDTRTA